MSYGTLEGANEYHAARGNTDWSGTDDQKNIARLLGSEYVDNVFRAQFPGRKTGLRSQVREWPRTSAQDNEGNAIASTTVPDEVVHAAYESALRELLNPGGMMRDYDPATQAKREKVDVLEVEYNAPHGVRSVLIVSTRIRSVIAPVLTGETLSRVAGRTARV